MMSKKVFFFLVGLSVTSLILTGVDDTVSSFHYSNNLLVSKVNNARQSDPNSGDTSDSEDNNDLDVGSNELLYRYSLCAIIALSTLGGVLVLIYFISRDPDHTTQSQLELSLSIIAVALIVEATLILAILDRQPEKYEALYAAIAGYVLGRVGGSKEYIGKEKGKEKEKE